MPTQSSDKTSNYMAEIRFGVVMYGGVSLAIYINGVTNELFELACATPRSGIRFGSDPGADPQGGPRTRDIYWRLSLLAGDAALRASYAEAIKAAGGGGGIDAGSRAARTDVWSEPKREDSLQTRFVVDVISGTSAGGINGVFLAKALAQGVQFKALKDLWVKEGDIGLLLNDSRSNEGNTHSSEYSDAEPKSLLNSDRMYGKIRYALGEMQKQPLIRAPEDKDGSPLVEEIDLFVTTTDILGSAVPLRLFDKVVYERRYKQSYHFSYPSDVTPSGNDFDAINDPFLAFAARCTSSFPFAFEPMTLNKVVDLKAVGEVSDLKRWNAFFPNLPRDEVAAGKHVHRAFGDGGYLDNKPFSYVVETLSRRFASVPIERKLVYIEPSPEKLDPHEMPKPGEPPNALENALAALTSIPRYEGIREDLQAVLQRNRRIERVERMVRLGESDIEKQRNPFAGVLSKKGKVIAWTKLKLSDMARYYGLAFLPYQRLRVFAVTDGLADRLGARWGIDRDSDHRYALRALVRVWREKTYSEEGKDRHPTLNAFLDQFDIEYRLRRLGFLLRKVDQLIRMFHKYGAAEATGNTPEWSEVEKIILPKLPEPFTGLWRGPNSPERNVSEALEVLRTLKGCLNDVRSALLDAMQPGGNEDASGAEKFEENEELRFQLRGILMQVLGESTAADLKADEDAKASNAKANGEPAKFVLPKSMELNERDYVESSRFRTLQEAVLFRAEKMFDLIKPNLEEKKDTRLVQALKDGLDALRVKRLAGDDDPDGLKLNRISERAWLLLGKPELVLKQGSDKDVELRVQNAGESPEASEKLLPKISLLNTDTGHSLRSLLAEYYLRFDSYDQVSLPLYYDTGTGEPSTVAVIRVSPADATGLIDEADPTLGRPKLAGTALASFGAFLDRRWRNNDIMWGRLDGAERLVQSILPASDEDTKIVRAELIERAHQSILREALVPKGEQELVKLVVNALEDVPENDAKSGWRQKLPDREGLASKLEALFGDNGLSRRLRKTQRHAPGKQTTSERLKQLLEQLKIGNELERGRLITMFESLLRESALTDYVRKTYSFDPNPDPKITLENAARAVTIVGRVLQGISSNRSDSAKLVLRWLARVGQILQGLVAVSLPGTLNWRVWRHGLRLLYAFEAFAVVAAVLLGSGNTRTLALTVFGLTLAVHLLSLILGDLMREKRRWVYVGVAVLMLVVGALAVVGGLALSNAVVQNALCVLPAGTQTQASGWPGQLCGWLTRPMKSP